MNKKIIFCIILIIVILVFVFLSQRVYSWEIEKKLLSDAANYAGAYLAKGSNWAISSIYPKINGEVKNGGATIQKGIDQAQQKVSEGSQNIGTQVENYFSGITNAIQGKDTSVCPPTTSQTSNP